MIKVYYFTHVQVNSDKLKMQIIKIITIVTKQRVLSNKSIHIKWIINYTNDGRKIRKKSTMKNR